MINLFKRYLGNCVFRNIVLLLLLSLLLIACGGEEPTQIGDGQAQVELGGQVELGETVYVENCASCHGANLEGEPDWQTPNPDGTLKAPPHDDDGHTWHHPDEYIYERIRYGTENLAPNVQAQSNMPAYQDVLSDEEIEAVVEYIKSQWSPRVREMQEARN